MKLAITQMQKPPSGPSATNLFRKSPLASLEGRVQQPTAENRAPLCGDVSVSVRGGNSSLLQVYNVKYYQKVMKS